MKKVSFILMVVSIVFLAVCASMMEMTWNSEVVFSLTEYDRVWNACVAEFMHRNCEIMVSDRDAGLLKAEGSAPLYNYSDRFVWTAHIVQGESEVSMIVHIDIPALYGRASKYVDGFIMGVERRLE